MNPARLTRRALLTGVAVGAGALVAACRGGDSTRGIADPPRTADPPPATPAIRRGLTGAITVSYADELGKKPVYVEEAAARVRTANPDARVRIDLQKVNSGAFYTSLLDRLASGDAPDVIHVGGERIGELAAAGHIIPLDDYLRDWPDWRYYPPWVQASVTYQGHIWAVPYGLDTRFLYYRRDLFRTSGLDPAWRPEKLDDLIDAATVIKRRRPDVIPYALYAGPAGDAGTANHAFVPLLWAYGGMLQDERGRWIGDSVPIRKTLAYYARAYQELRLVPPALLTTARPWVGMREQLGNGGLALLFEGGWVYGGWKSREPAGTEQHIGYLLHPAEHSGPSFTVGGPGTCWYVTAASRNKDLAWAFVAAWNTRDTVARLNAEDPHPVARVDAVRVEEYRRDPFLVYSTNSLEKARFIAPDPDFGVALAAIQRATASVATGEARPEQAAQRYAEDLAQSIGADRVVTQT